MKQKRLLWPAFKCNVCGGDKYVDVLDNDGQRYVGCAQCVIQLVPPGVLSAHAVHAAMQELSKRSIELEQLMGSEWVARVSYVLGEGWAERMKLERASRSLGPSLSVRASRAPRAAGGKSKK